MHTDRKTALQLQNLQHGMQLTCNVAAAEAEGFTTTGQ